MKTSLRLLLVSAVALAVPAALAAATVQENWTKDCQKCHGADGSAGGPMGKKLKLKNYTDPAVNAAMTDEEIIKAIKEGVKEEGSEKMKMPAYGTKDSEEEVLALKDLIRGFVKPQGT